MTSRTYDVIHRLDRLGLTLATAESCTGGGIGEALTEVPGSSRVYLGGVISYTNGVKEKLLGVPRELLDEVGAVSGPVAKAMAQGARRVIGADAAVSVTGLAGPGGDAFGTPVGTVGIGLSWAGGTLAEKHLFFGGREAVRRAACTRALEWLLETFPEAP